MIDPSENEEDAPASNDDQQEEEETDEEREARLAAEREKEDSETMKKFKGAFDSSDDFNPKEVDSQFGISTYYKSRSEERRVGEEGCGRGRFGGGSER